MPFVGSSLVAQLWLFEFISNFMSMISPTFGVIIFAAAQLYFSGANLEFPSAAVFCAYFYSNFLSSAKEVNW